MDALLPDFWFFLLGLILLIYVLLDGLALGVGILSLGCRDEDQRSLLLGTIAPVWHAGQTWLVILGGLLFGAFPPAYGLILSGLYLPLLLMFCGLIFRAVSLEYREEAQWKTPWNLACGWGSLLAALAQGLVLGGLVQGLKVENGRFAGSVWDWLQPFPVLVAVGLICGYVLLGAAYLILKTGGDLQRRSYRQARVAAGLVLLALVVPGVRTYFQLTFLASGSIGWLLFFAAALLALTTGLFYSLRQGRESAPLLWGMAIFVMAFTGLLASLYPHIIPPVLTIAGAAAPPLTLKVMLALTAPLLPVMLAYNAYLHRTFRGKTREGGYGYED